MQKKTEAKNNFKNIHKKPNNPGKGQTNHHSLTSSSSALIFSFSVAFLERNILKKFDISG